MTNIIYAIIFLIVNSFLFAQQPGFIPNRILFCLNKDIETLSIERKSDGNFITNNEALNEYLETIQISKLERWLKGANEFEHDGDIYLNRIFRLTLDSRSNVTIDKVKESFESFNFIHSATYEPIRKPVYTPNDSQYNQQWFLPHILANNAWDLWDINSETPGDRSILLASVDTGVDWDHPDLRNNIWQNLAEDANGNGTTIIQQGGSWILDPGDLNGIDEDGNGYLNDLIGWDVSGYDGNLYGDNDPMPPPGVGTGGTWAHGTHVAGLLAGSTNNNLGIASVAFNCSIMAVKVSTGEQDYPYITHGYDGILYAARAGFIAQGFSIVNNSWGGGYYNQYEQATINVAHNDYNAVIICAAGNGDEDSWGETDDLHFPSSYDNVISVCAMGNNDVWGHWATYGETVDIASPGEGIRSTKMGTGYTSWSGSSMAAPIVGSVMGLMKSFNPTWNNEQLTTMVLATADPVIYQVNQESYLQGKLGTGRVDAFQAVVTPLFPKLEFAGTDINVLNDTNGEINPGEQFELRLVLFNDFEWGEATNLSATVISESSDVNVITGTANFGDVAPGDAGLNDAEPFILQFDYDAEPGIYNLTVQMISNVNGSISYTSDFSIDIELSEGQSIVYGDLNQDGVFDILDVVTTVNIVMGVQIPDAYQAEAADLNQDGISNILDIVQIVNLILGT